MGSVTTAFCSSAKGDMLSAGHCFNAVQTFTATGTSTQTWTAVSSLTGLAVGMILSGTNVASGSVLAAFLSTSSIFVSKASTGALGTITATGDTFNMMLFITSGSLTGTYGAATTNYTQVTGNSDELANGSGYTTGGTGLTNVSPVVSSTTAYINFSPNPSWTSASFTTSGAMIYNNTQRGPLATRSVAVYSFGGNQSVSSGTFTAVMPSAAPGTAILQIS